MYSPYDTAAHLGIIYSIEIKISSYNDLKQIRLTASFIIV